MITITQLAQGTHHGYRTFTLNRLENATEFGSVYQITYERFVGEPNYELVETLLFANEAQARRIFNRFVNFGWFPVEPTAYCLEEFEEWHFN